jgi:hypothetical protein
MSAARDKVIGSTIRNTAEMLHMETGKRRINSADVAPVARVALVVPEDLVARVALVVREAQAELAVQVEAEAQAGLAVQVAREAQAGLAVQVAREAQAGLVVPVEAELELSRVEELGLVPAVEAVPVQSHLRARLAVPLRTKSVIAVHHRGRVPLLAAVEDLAAVAEIMPAQAAAEAVTAWEAAE